MQEFLIITILFIVFFGVIRRFIFFSAHNAFTKAAQDFQKQQQQQQDRLRKSAGKVTIERKKDDGEYVPYEEIE